MAAHPPPEGPDGEGQSTTGDKPPGVPPTSDDSIDLSEDPSKVRRHVPVLRRASLLRLLGVPSLYAIGYGDVGSSIYYALGVTTIYAAGMAPLAIAIAGVFFVFTTLTYAEL